VIAIFTYLHIPVFLHQNDDMMLQHQSENKFQVSLYFINLMESDTLVAHGERRNNSASERVIGPKLYGKKKKKKTE
jgi:hypothetical protein